MTWGCPPTRKCGIGTLLVGREKRLVDELRGIMAKDKKIEAGVDGLGKDNGVASLAAIENDLLGSGKDFIQTAIDRVRHIRMMIEAMVDKIGFADIDGEVAWRSLESRSQHGGQFGDWVMAFRKGVINFRLRDARFQRGLVGKPPFRNGRAKYHRNGDRDKKNPTT